MSGRALLAPPTASACALCRETSAGQGPVDVEIEAGRHQGFHGRLAALQPVELLEFGERNRPGRISCIGRGAPRRSLTRFAAGGEKLQQLRLVQTQGLAQGLGQGAAGRHHLQPAAHPAKPDPGVPQLMQKFFQLVRLCRGDP